MKINNNFTIDYDFLKDNFVLKKNGNEFARLPRVSVIVAVNECLCNAGNGITLFENGLPIAYISRKIK